MKKVFLKKNRESYFLIFCLFYTISFMFRANGGFNFKITTNSSFLYKTCLEYTTNWMRDLELIEEFTKEKHAKGCEKCKYKIDPWEGDSTNRDAIVTFAINFPAPYIPMIRSLRTVKSKAKIIILVDANMYNIYRHERFYKQRNKCDFMFVNVGRIDKWSCKNLYQTRTFLYRDFLFSYGLLFDRIILCDLSDILYQSDPFKPFMRDNAVYCYKENFTIKYEKHALKSYREMGDDLDENTVIVTPAVYFGNPFEMLKLIDYVDTFFFDKSGNYSTIHDQAVITLLYYRRYYVDYGINMKQIDWDGGIISANTHDLKNTTIGATECIGCKVKPFIIHHTQYIDEISEDFYRKCPRTNNMKTNMIYYISGLPDTRLDEIDKEIGNNFVNVF